MSQEVKITGGQFAIGCWLYFIMWLLWYIHDDLKWIATILERHWK